MNLLRRIGALALLAAPTAAWAIAPDLNTRLAAMEAATKSAQSAGDNAWMLVSSALVLMMTAPGLALFYGGLVRRKNVLGTMMHSFILMAVVTVIWAVVGYSLAFGGSSPYLGNFQFAFLDGVGSTPGTSLRPVAWRRRYPMLPSRCALPQTPTSQFTPVWSTMRA